MNFESLDNLEFRCAESNDIEFLASSFIEADKGNSDICPTTSIFNLDYDEFKKFFQSFLTNIEIVDCEYSLSSYFVAENLGKLIASFSSWIEGKSGMESNLIKINCWIEVLGIQKVQSILPNLEIINNYTLKRLENYLQLEYLYVLPQYRKYGILKKLIKNRIEKLRKYDIKFSGLQTMLFKENVPSYNFFNSRGFNINEEVTVGPEALGIYFGHKTRLSMILDIHKLDEFLNSL